MRRDFRFWCQKVLPLVYDDSLSYYEVLAKVVKKLNELAESTGVISEDLVNLKEYVDNYFGSSDFSEIIENALQKLVDDGTMEQLINEEVLDDIGGRVDALEKKNFVPAKNIVPRCYGYLAYNDYPHNHVGAMCSIGTTQYIISAPRSGYYSTDNIGVFRTADVSSNRDNIESITECKLGHANSICYYGTGKLLVAPIQRYTSSTEAVGLNELYVINTSGVYLYSISTPVNIVAVSHDYVTGKTYAFSYGSMDNAQLNGTNTYTGNYYEVVNDSLEFIANWTHLQGYNQDVAVWNGIAYVSSPHNAIHCVDLAKNEIIDQLGVSNMNDTGGVILGEMDGFEFDENGHLFCAFDANIGGNGSIGFICELLVGTAINYYGNAWTTMNRYSVAGRTLTVEPSSTVLVVDTEHAKTPLLLHVMGDDKMNINRIRFIESWSADYYECSAGLISIGLAPNVNLNIGTFRLNSTGLQISGEGGTTGNTITLGTSIVNGSRVYQVVLQYVNVVYPSSMPMFSINGNGSILTLQGNATVTNGTINGVSPATNTAYMLIHNSVINLNNLA